MKVNLFGILLCLGWVALSVQLPAQSNSAAVEGEKAAVTAPAEGEDGEAIQEEGEGAEGGKAAPSEPAPKLVTKVTGFMHGFNDKAAAPVDLTTLASEQQLAVIQQEQKFSAFGREITGGIVTLDDNHKVLAFEKPLLKADDITGATGRIIRFFIWISAENVKATGNLWAGAPSLRLELFDGLGNLVSKSESLFKTRGTYPWHCYYLDLPIPRTISLTQKAINDANVKKSGGDSFLDDVLADVGGGDFQNDKPGLYLTLTSNGGGKAHFAGLSWQVIPEAKEVPVDADSGSKSPNPKYDELPALLSWGVDGTIPWKFLDGNEAFQDIKTIQGLKKYLASAKDDWYHMQKGVAMLPYLHLNGTVLNLLTTPFEEKWLETLATELGKMQDPTTGFWTADGVPNLMVTAAIANGCYAPLSQRRSDEKRTNSPWSSMGANQQLPYPEKIIDTLIGCRIPDGFGWNQFALQPDELVKDAVRVPRSDLAVTAAAMSLLALCYDTLPAESPYREVAANAIKDAYHHILKNHLIKNQRLGYLWRDSSNLYQHSTTGVGMLEALEATRVLERRVNTTLPKPVLVCKDVPGEEVKISVTWKRTDAKLTSIRVFCVPKDSDPQFITEKNLVGIINTGNANDEDPYLLVRKIVASAKSFWGMTPDKAGAAYIGSKLAMLPRRIIVGTPAKGITVGIPASETYSENAENAPTEYSFYAAGVNDYGEMTEYILLQPQTAENKDEF